MSFRIVWGAFYHALCLSSDYFPDLQPPSRLIGVRGTFFLKGRS
jgi:hypothetical protein